MRLLPFWRKPLAKVLIGYRGLSFQIGDGWADGVEEIALALDPSRQRSALMP